MGAPMSSFKVDEPWKAFLTQSDGVAVSFWIISIAMIAATVFFFAEASTVNDHWRTSLHVGGLVTLVAGVHYMYMREYWVQLHKSPVVYRYIDWSITVPLQMIEFNLILKAAQAKVDAGSFWRLLIGTILMLTFGYIGETTPGFGWPGFVLGILGWFFILYEIFAGKSSEACPKTGAVAASFKNMRIIVSAGWSIYPLGYFLGFLTGVADQTTLNVVYNVADLVNKICFVLACWACAKEDSKESLLA